MSAYTLGRMARIFDSLGYIDTPEEGNVTYRPILNGLIIEPTESARANVDALVGELDRGEANRTDVLGAEEEAAFWEGYRSQKPYNRRGRPYKGTEPRRSRTLQITDTVMLQLRIAGKGNASDGLERILEEYTRLPDVQE